MGKRETKETYKESREAAGEVPGQYKPLQEEAAARAAGYNPNPALAGQREEIASGYRGMMGEPRQMGSYTIGAPGKINTGELSETYGQYGKFRDTGGLSAENIERMRGMGGFEEFAKTGGYSPESIANIKSQAISPIGSYATGTRDELARRRAVQGGYAPGFDAANRALQRDTARAIADTSLNANVAIQDRINQGRQWGIGGLAQSEAGLAGMQTGNRLAALGGETNVGNALAGYRGQDIQNAMAAEMFNAQQNTGADQFNILNAQGQQAAGLAGLGGLYGNDLQYQQAEYDRQAGILDAMNRARGGYLSEQGVNARQPGVGGNIAGMIGSAAGIGAGMMAPRIGGTGGFAGGNVFTPRNWMQQQIPRAPGT